ARVHDLHSVLAAVLVGRVRHVQLDADLAGPARVIWRHRSQVAERPARGVLDQLARPQRRDLTRAEPAEPALDGDRGQSRAEQITALAAARLVAGHEQDRAVPVAAEGGVDS